MSSSATAAPPAAKPAPPITLKKAADPEINMLFRQQIKFNASDLHLQVGKPPILRVRGTLRELTLPPITEEVMLRMFYEIMDARNQQIFLTRAGFENIHGREDTLVGDLAVEDDFGVARALELFKNHFVHAAASIDQRGRDDRQRSTLFDVARRTEEALRTLQRIGVNTTRQHLAR